MNQILKNRRALMVIVVLIAIMGLSVFLLSIPYSTYSSTIIVINYPSSSDSYIAGESVSISVTFNPSTAPGMNPACVGYQILYKEKYLYEEGSTEVVLKEDTVTITKSSFTVTASFIPSEYRKYTIRAGMLINHDYTDGVNGGGDTYIFSTLLDLLVGADEIEYYNQVTIIDSQVTVLVTTETVVTTVIPEPVTIVTTIIEEGETITTTIVTTTDRTVVETLLVTIEKSVTSYEPSFDVIPVIFGVFCAICYYYFQKRREEESI